MEEAQVGANFPFGLYLGLDIGITFRTTDGITASEGGIGRGGKRLCAVGGRTGAYFSPGSTQFSKTEPRRTPHLRELPGQVGRGIEVSAANG